MDRGVVLAFALSFKRAGRGGAAGLSCCLFFTCVCVPIDCLFFLMESFFQAYISPCFVSFCVQAYMDEGAALAFKQSEMEKTVRKARGALRGVQEERDSLAKVRVVIGVAVSGRCCFWACPRQHAAAAAAGVIGAC